MFAVAALPATPGYKAAIPGYKAASSRKADVRNFNVKKKLVNVPF